MFPRLSLALMTLLIAFFTPAMALAHSDMGGTGFSAGFSHPVLGLDHLLAMLSVGMLSAQMGGRALWSVPLTFVVVMLVGGVMGMMGIPLFSIELGISLSVLVLGVAIAFGRRLPTVLVMVGVSFFAVFHGYAHGQEMPSIAQPVLYALGFAAGTGVIHLVGVFMVQLFKQLKQGRALVRYCGAGIAGVGIYLLSGL
ncbi:HupE/UreJ family protein [Neptunomonas phycophila]|uniref:HupE/UreJ family protein n=1 Tax=Neptunomonas phycophila TaxID=1572645 RepID=UPI000948F264|nr:HupE/UreJ family protein [Neptunomonas phycophila]